MKECSYRNCKKDVGERKGKKYCCKACKDMENTYKKRRRDFIEKYSRQEMKNVELVKFIQNIK